MSAHEWLAELGAAIEQPLLTVEGYCDFGGFALPAPLARVETRSLEEARRVLAIARRQGIPIAPRGAGHSSGGHTSAPHGIVLEHRPRGELRWLGNAIEVPAGWTWARVERELEGSGRELAVTTSSVQTTVAGTLSAAGYGPRSVRHGPQVDQVQALWLLTPDGALARCSADENQELFGAALTGLGAIGLLHRVRIETVPRAEHLAFWSARHASYAEVADSFAWLAAGEAADLDYFRVLGRGGAIESFCATSHALRAEAERRAREHGRARLCSSSGVLAAGEFARDDRHMPLDLWRGCRHLWSDYCFDAVGFARFARFVDAELAGARAPQIAYALATPPRSGPALALDLRPPRAAAAAAERSPRLLTFGLFYSVPSADTLAIARARAAQSQALELCLELGGRPYLYGMWGGPGGLSRARLGRIFGGPHARLCAARARLDPAGIWNPAALA